MPALSANSASAYQTFVLERHLQKRRWFLCARPVRVDDKQSRKSEPYRIRGPAVSTDILGGSPAMSGVGFFWEFNRSLLRAQSRIKLFRRGCHAFDGRSLCQQPTAASGGAVARRIWVQGFTGACGRGKHENHFTRRFRARTGNRLAILFYRWLAQGWIAGIQL